MAAKKSTLKTTPKPSATKPASIKKSTIADTDPISAKTPSSDWIKILNRPWVRIVGVILLILIATAILFKDRFIVAWVNGKPILRSEYTAEMENRVGEQVLQDLVTRRLILSEAQSQGVVVTLEDISARIAQIEEQLSSQGNTLDQVLLSQGISRSELQEQIRIQLLVEKLAPEDASASAESIANFINENRELLPEEASDAELEDIARSQLESSQGQITAWLDELQKKANISYW
jgi:hypothetical protein